MPAGTIRELVRKHEQAHRDLSDTLTRSGQFELAEIKKGMRDHAKKTDQ